MPSSLGSIRGQMILDVKQALASYTAVRLANLQTVTALHTGAGALQSLGGGMAAVGAGLAAAIYLAVDAAADFERELDYFSAVSNSTQEQYDAIREKALQLGEDTTYSAGEIARSFVELGKAGVAAEDIINGIGEAVTNLGAAADIPLDTAASIMMSAVQTFGLGAEEAVRVADLLAGAANASILEVEDLGVSLKYAGGVAASLGIPIEDVIDSLALLGTYGIRGSTAGTSLRQMLVSLGGATGPATAQLKELGIITEDGSNKFFDATGSAKSLGEIFQILQDATAGMGDEQRLAALKTIFQNRALASAIALTNEGVDGFAAMHAEVGKTTAMEVASERLDNLSGDIEMLKGNLETLAITQGSQLQEFLRGIVQGVTQVIQWFSSLNDSTQQTILRFITITAAVLIVVGIFGMLAGSVLNMIALGIQLAPVFTLLINGIRAVTVATWGWTASLLANPITWIIIAIIALVAIFIYLWNNVDGFRNFFLNAWEAIKTGFAAVMDWFAGIPPFFSNLWDNIVNWTTNAWDNIVNFFKSIPERILNFFLNWTLPGLLIQHWDSIVAFATSAWNGLLNFFRAIPGNIANFFAELPGRLGYIIGFMVGTVTRLILQLGTWVLTTGLAAWNGFITFFSELPGRIGAFFGNLWTTVTNWLNELWIAAQIKALQIVIGMVTFFQELPGRISNFFQDMYNRAISWLTNMWNQAVNRAAAIYTGIVNWVRQLPGQVAQFFLDLYNNVVNKLNDAKNRAVEIATNIYNGVRNAITGLPGQVRDIFNNVVQAIKDKITSAFNAVRDFASGLWEGFKDGLGIHSPSFIERAIWQITGVLEEETDRMKNQVRGFQKLGAQLDNIGGNGTGFALDTAGSVAEELAKAAKYQAEMEALARNVNAVKRAAPTVPSLSAAQATALAAKNSAAAGVAAPPPVLNARFFIGDREITDIVRVEIDDALDEVALGATVGVVG